MQVTIGNTLYVLTRDYNGKFVVESVDLTTSTVRYHQDAFGQPTAFPNLDLALRWCQAAQM